MGDVFEEFVIAGECYYVFCVELVGCYVMVFDGVVGAASDGPRAIITEGRIQVGK